MRLLNVRVGNLHLLHIVRVIWERIEALIERLLYWHALISLLTLVWELLDKSKSLSYSEYIETIAVLIGAQDMMVSTSGI